MRINADEFAKRALLNPAHEFNEWRRTTDLESDINAHSAKPDVRSRLSEREDDCREKNSGAEDAEEGASHDFEFGHGLNSEWRLTKTLDSDWRSIPKAVVLRRRERSPIPAR